MHRQFGITVITAVAIFMAAADSPSQDAPVEAKDGLSINEPGAFQGYSLVAPMNSTSTYLIDMEGRIVNEWKSDYTPALSAYLLENGHLLRPGAERGFGGGGAGAGGRIQEFDWDGELVWDYSFGESRLRPHHDICPLPNGNLLVVASDPKTAEEAVAAGRRPETVGSQLLPDCILEIKPTGPTTGEIVWEWHAWDHLVQDFDDSTPNYGDVSEHPELIDLNFVTEMFDRMMRDPQQLARLRSLGYVGGGTPNQPGAQGGAGRDRQPPRDGQGPDPQPSDRDGGGPEQRGRGRGGPGGGFGPMGGDWMHVNSVAYNPALDQIMLSVHEFSEVWIVDHSTTTEQAASHKGGRSGKGGDLLYRWGNPRVYRSGANVDQRLFAQHCADWISDGLPGAGNMLVFNNGNGRPDGNYSSVDEVVLPVDSDGNYEKEEFLAFAPERATWSYSAADKSSFFSMLISGAQRLPNGNTFICSGNQGILFEVTPDSETVWQFKYPGAGFGGPGGPGGFRPGGPGGFRPGELVPGFLQQILGVTDEQRESIHRLQGYVDVKLAVLLTDEQRETRDERLRFPFGAPGGFGAFGGGRPDPDGDRPRRDDDRPAPDRGQRPDGREPDGPDRGPAGFRPPRPGEVIPGFLIEDLALSKDQTGELEELQQTVDDRLAGIWTDEQKTRLEEMENAFARGPGVGNPGFGPPGGLGPPGGPGGRGGPGGGGPGGIFRSYRYGIDYAGLAGRDLEPGERLEEVVGRPQPPRGRPDAD